MKREIIVGYDPEHEGEDVLDLGRILSEVLAAKPRVVTAVPWPDYLIGIVDLDEQMEVEMRDRFALIHDELDDLGVETDAIASRTPASTLAEIAETDQAQMIVVGSCHHGPVGRTLAGSVGESLLDGALGRSLSLHAATPSATRSVCSGSPSPSMAPLSHGQRWRQLLASPSGAMRPSR